ncbi:MAG: hypothetical protein LBT16_01175 [Treponema sp.]|jgi:16S rRNA G966 N2-methylase RsmD|nr:hypothetical protein [Treponema sp.]
MQLIYYASFVPGMGSIIEKVIRERLTDGVIQKLLDGAVVFKTACSYDKLNFFCFNNIFAVINIIEKPVPSLALDSHMKQACALGANPVITENNGKIRSFRIIASRENKPAAVNEKIKADTEKYIAKESGLAVDRARPDTEFWFLYRSEGFSVFMKRLTRHGSFEKTLHPGELPLPLAWMLCRLSEPLPGDTVCDPFCGYGSIPSERLTRFPVTCFYAFDIDPKVLNHARNKISAGLQSRGHFEKADFRRLTALLPPKSIDAIITDPPWGFYDKKAFGEGEGEEFYADMVSVFGKVLKSGGRAVVLTAKTEILRGALEKEGVFEKKETIPILLSGKKAVVFVLGRK